MFLQYPAHDQHIVLKTLKAQYVEDELDIEDAPNIYIYTYISMSLTVI